MAWREAVVLVLVGCGPGGAGKPVPGGADTDAAVGDASWQVDGIQGVAGSFMCTHEYCWSAGRSFVSSRAKVLGEPSFG